MKALLAECVPGSRYSKLPTDLLSLTFGHQMTFFAWEVVRGETLKLFVTRAGTV